MLAARSGARKTGGVRRWQGAHAGHGRLGVWRAVGPAEGHGDEAPGAPFSDPILVADLWLLHYGHTHFGHLRCLPFWFALYSPLIRRSDSIHRARAKGQHAFMAAVVYSRMLYRGGGRSTGAQCRSRLS